MVWGVVGGIERGPEIRPGRWNLAAVGRVTARLHSLCAGGEADGKCQLPVEQIKGS